ncbi:hypothetical protein WN943_023012 [Citrus x changshan-huyou]
MDQTIGMLARQVIPIVYNDWRKVPQIYKEELWKYIQIVILILVDTMLFENDNSLWSNGEKHKMLESKTSIIIAWVLVMKETGLSELQIDRSILWKEGRKSKSGEFKPEALPIVNKIEDDLNEKQLKKRVYNVIENEESKKRAIHVEEESDSHKTIPYVGIEEASPDNKILCHGDETIMRMKISEDIEHIISSAEEHSRILKMKRYEEIERFLTMAQELLRFQGKKVYFEDLIYGQCDINTYITIEDCSVLAYFEELTVNCLMIWTMKLYEELKRIGMTMKYKFMNPDVVSLSGRANTNKSQIDRTKIIVSQLEGIQSGQLCFMPYNPKFHWVLIVIDMDSNTIYYLDPMRQPVHMDLRLLLNNAMARLNVKESASSNKVKFFGKKTYNEKEIDEIRKEWASFFLGKVVIISGM